MAQSTISQRLALEGVQDIINQLRGMGDAGETAIRRIHSAAATGSLERFNTTIENAKKTIDGARGSFSTLENAIGPALSRLNRFSRSFEELRGTVGALAPVMKDFVEVGIGAAFLLAARSAASATREITNQAAELGITVKEFEGLSYAAATVGVSMDSARRSFDRFMARLGEAQREEADFASNLALKAREYDLQQEKLNQTIQREEQVQARARRTQEENAVSIERATLEVKKYGMALNQQSLEREKFNESLQKTIATTGSDTRTQVQRTKDIISGQREEINVGNQKVALEHQLHAITESNITQAETIRNSQARIKEANEELAISQDKAAAAAAKARNEFQRLGIDLRGTNGEFKSGKQVYLEFADAINMLPTAAEKAAALLKVFGRGWSEQLPLLRLGSKEIERLSDEFDKLGLGLEETAAMGIAFNSSWNKMLFILDATKNAVGNIVGQIFVPLFDAVSDFFSNSQKGMREFAQAFVDILLPPIKFVIATIIEIKAAFDDVAESLNSVFGTNFTGASLIIELINIRLSVTVLNLLFKTLGPLIIQLGGLFIALAPKIALAARALFTIGGAINAIELTALFAAIGPAGWVAIGLAALAAWALTATDSWDLFFVRLKKGFLDLIDFLGAVYNVVKAVAEVVERAFGFGGTAPASSPARSPTVTESPAVDPSSFPAEGDYRNFTQAKSEGGWIGGSGRGDHVPIVAEPGEFMVKRSVAQRVGDFLSALNSGRVRGYANGGFIGNMDNLLPAMASPSLPAARQSDDRALFHLTIEGRTFKGLSAPKDTANDLLQHARTSSMISAGTKPSWNGSG